MIKVTFGEHDRCNDSRRPESRFVLRATAGKFSFLNFDNDIALLRLNDRVPITQNIKPICLPKKKGMFICRNSICYSWPEILLPSWKRGTNCKLYEKKFIVQLSKNFPASVITFFINFMKKYQHMFLCRTSHNKYFLFM